MNLHKGKCVLVFNQVLRHKDV